MLTIWELGNTETRTILMTSEPGNTAVLWVSELILWVFELILWVFELILWVSELIRLCFGCLNLYFGPPIGGDRKQTICLRPW